MKKKFRLDIGMLIICLISAGSGIWFAFNGQDMAALFALTQALIFLLHSLPDGRLYLLRYLAIVLLGCLAILLTTFMPGYWVLTCLLSLMYLVLAALFLAMLWLESKMIYVAWRMKGLRQ